MATPAWAQEWTPQVAAHDPPELSAAVGVRRTRSWHASTGVWIAIVLLILSATGLTWSTYAGGRFDLVQEAFDSASLAPDTTLASGGDHSGHTGSRTSANVDLDEVDTALATARNAGLTGPVEITPAAEPGQAWTVAQADNVWPVRRDIAAVDPGSGTVTDHVRWNDQPLLAQLSSLGVQAHMGILVMAALCWAIPLLGWSLAAFLLLDVLTGLVHRRRANRAPLQSR